MRSDPPQCFSAWCPRSQQASSQFCPFNGLHSSCTLWCFSYTRGPKNTHATHKSLLVTWCCL